MASVGASALPVPPQHPERLVYLGTPSMAVAPLVALHDAGFDIALVVTGEDKRRGRRSAPEPTPVKAAALERGLRVSHDLSAVVEVDADLGVVVAYGKILRLPLLEQLPMVNLHFSLLPRWRGAAPVERAILAGDAETGVCVMAVEEGLDTGGVYAKVVVPIGPSQSASDLSQELAAAGSRLLVDTLRKGIGPAKAQTGEPTYASKLGTADRRLDWTRPAEELHRITRIGGAWTTFRGARFKVHEAVPVDLHPEADPEPGTLHDDVVTCGRDGLRLVTVQPEGKGRVPFDDWANGARPGRHERLGEEAP